MVHQQCAWQTSSTMVQRQQRGIRPEAQESIWSWRSTQRGSNNYGDYVHLGTNKYRWSTATAEVDQAEWQELDDNMGRPQRLASCWSTRPTKAEKRGLNNMERPTNSATCDVIHRVHLDFQQRIQQSAVEQHSIINYKPQVFNFLYSLIQLHATCQQACSWGGVLRINTSILHQHVAQRQGPWALSQQWHTKVRVTTVWSNSKFYRLVGWLDIKVPSKLKEENTSPKLGKDSIQTTSYGWRHRSHANRMWPQESWLLVISRSNPDQKDVNEVIKFCTNMDERNN